MNSKLSAGMFPPTWLRLLVIILFILGVFFRFVNIDRKVYWFDEAFTSLRISGYTETEAITQVCDGHEIGVEDLLKYQHPTPEKTLADTIKSLALEDPQHPPLYYLIARFWVQWFGSSVAVTRSLSALFSLLVFPCIYWLCLELFKSSLIGWVAIALIAVSPFHVLYAQEAREYSLWSVTILLSSATLLRAMRLNTKLSWGMYAVTVALGLYTFLFSGLVTIAHGIYVIVIEKFRLTKRVYADLLASGVGLLVFTPWLLVVITQSAQIHKTTGWTADQKVSLLFMIRKWTVNLTYFFVDFDYDLSRGTEGSVLKYAEICLGPLILIFAGYSLYFLYRHAPKQGWLFILALIGGTALPLAIPDCITGGVRSQVPRYLIPCYLGIQLAVAYLLATQITFPAIKIWRRKLWQLVQVTLISGGVLSCVISSQAESWWYKDLNLYTLPVAHIINQATHPLLIAYCQGTWPLGDKLSLSHALASKVRLQIVKEPNMPYISPGFSDVFLQNPSHSPELQILPSRLEKEQKYKIEDVYPRNFELLKLVKESVASPNSSPLRERSNSKVMHSKVNN